MTLLKKICTLIITILIFSKNCYSSVSCNNDNFFSLKKTIKNVTDSTLKTILNYPKASSLLGLFAISLISIFPIYKKSTKKDRLGLYMYVLLDLSIKMVSSSYFLYRISCKLKENKTYEAFFFILGWICCADATYFQLEENLMQKNLL